MKNTAMYQRMLSIRRSGAAGIHADQKRKTDPKQARRVTRQQERQVRQNGGEE